MAGRGGPQTVSVDGRRIRLTNLDKVLYPETGTTKADVLHYYAQIATYLVPHTANRPATRKRWVNGVGTAAHPGEVFYEKNLPTSAPEWVTRRSIVHRSGTTEYPLVNDRATLTWLAQIAALEVHVPQWQFSHLGHARNPDRLVLDLDPGPGAGLAECAEVALMAREILSGMGLDPLPVTSGSKGIHLYSALDGRWTSDQVSAVAHELARVLESDHPDLIVSDMKKVLRERKVLVDWSQNNAAKTTIAPYSMRGRAHPMVAAPRSWEELESDDLRQLDYEEVLERVQEQGDLLRPLLASRDAGLEPTPEHMATFESTPEARDRLAKYRSMRDQAKTPEPVPSGPAVPTSGNSFVIQEHHARRLHYDFRLERDGVLVSWAVPKGPPLSGTENHLAVQTEDHPLEYGTFEGVIPKGEYGAGEVTIWDSGWYELEKWREGKEVIATLTGRPDGGLGGVPRKYALIHTGRGGDEKNWLIHLMEGKKRRGGTKTQAGSDERVERVEEAEAESTDGEQYVERVESTSDTGLSEAAELTQSAAATRAPAQTPEPTRPAGRLRGPNRSIRPMDPEDALPSSRIIEPMLAVAGSEADLDTGDQDDWSYEMKWDGYRAIVYIDGDNIRLLSRNRNDLTRTFPDLVEPLRAGIDAESAVLDGEIVALNRQGRPDFGLLQRRTGFMKTDGDASDRSSPVHLMLFDLLELNGERITGDSYDVRRAALDHVLTGSTGVHVPPHFDGDYAAAIQASQQLQLEGVVAKLRRSRYLPGRRSGDWLKIKLKRTQEAVIVGWRMGAAGLASLILAVPGADGLRYAGRVGTGFSDRDRRGIPTLLAAMEVPEPPVYDNPPEDLKDTRWVRPELVGEVTYGNWTRDGVLRHASWRGWRPDKSPADVRIEQIP